MRAARPSVPRVGVGVLVVRDGRVLLAVRRGPHGAGTWAPPGGYLEFGESLEACARRELAEETGLAAQRVTLGPYVETVFAEEGRHSLTVFATCAAAGEPATREPERHGVWTWHAWDALPAPLFAPLASLVARGWVPPGDGDLTGA